MPPQVLPALVATGYDACSTASNHTLDQGTDGVNRTLDDLDAAGLAHDGSYRTAQDAATPTIITTPHGRVGFISVAYGFNDGPPDQPWQVNTLDTDAILAKAHAARAAGADLVVVAVHAGTEYDTEPNTDQVDRRADPARQPGHRPGLRAPRARRATPAEDQREMGDLRAGQQHRRPGNPGRRHPPGAARPGHLQPGQHRRLDHQRHRLGAVPAGRRTAAPLVLTDRRQHLRSPAADAAALAATTDAVNLYGADTDGAHPLDHP